MKIVTLRVAWDADLRQLTCHVMGPIQLEVLRQRMQDRYRLAVDFWPLPDCLSRDVGRSNGGDRPL